MTSDPVSIVERFISEVLNGERTESATDVVANEPLRQRAAAFRAAFADLRVHTVRIVSEDRLVAVHLVGSGTHTGPFQGSPATGRAWSSSCTAIYEVDDGRIVDFWMTWDVLDILEQLRVVSRAAEVSA